MVEHTGSNADNIKRLAKETYERKRSLDANSYLNKLWFTNKILIISSEKINFHSTNNDSILLYIIFLFS